MRSIAIINTVLMFGLTLGVGCSEPVAKKQPADMRQSEGAPSDLGELFGTELVNAHQEKVSLDRLSGKIIGVYFSAHWCPPCQQFTPKLVDFYNTIAAEGKSFEIVFVSSDHNEEAMQEYMKELSMPWLALPYDSPHKEKLARKYGVRGIPTLVILDESGVTITKRGREDVTRDGAAAFDKWQKK